MLDAAIEQLVVLQVGVRFRFRLGLEKLSAALPVLAFFDEPFPGRPFVFFDFKSCSQ